MSDTETNTDTELTSTLIATSEAALSDTFQRPVMLGEPETLREKSRNFVLRCAVLESGTDLPASVIIKASLGEGDSAYDPEKDDPGSTSWRFYNEWAGTKFLSERNSLPPHCARLLAGDRAHGLFVLEDLGSGGCLADVVQASDPDKADEAFLSYARALGRMHADTVGQEAEWRQLRLAVSGLEQTRESEGVRWLRENVEPFRKRCSELDITLPAGFDEEAAAVSRTLDMPGPFNAFSPNDTCPDNHRIMPDGSLRFFDFEFAGFRHALLDAAYFHLPFPTCWCVNRLPAGQPQRMEDAYRSELVRGCPAAADDAQFDTALDHACACWTIVTLSWSLEHALKEDGKWGLSTVRQRHLLRLATFADKVSRAGSLPVMAAVALELKAKLHSLWPDIEPMPLYPAFR